MRKAETKVDAVVIILRTKKGHKASWPEIYEAVKKSFPHYAKSKYWQEGIRGVVYREQRAGVTFKVEGGVVSLVK